MSDKAISELIVADQITSTDRFVLEQNGTAKQLSGQVLLNWLTKAADGHGGIQSIVKAGTSGLVDTYRITLADTTIVDFTVTNGKAITSVTQTSVIGLTRTYTIAFNDATSTTFTVTDGRNITKVGKTNTSGLVDTYTITYNDGTTGTFTVTNGAKGDKGDNTYTWIKYASQEPTTASHSFGDEPDNWIGIYCGSSSTAPTDWQQYQWFKIKGETGDTGAPATLVSSAVAYQASNSGTVIPSGAWSAGVPVVAQGQYLWTRITNTFNTGSPVVSYSVSRMGLDGSGSVSSVANISPDENGNVSLTASDVGALPDTGGDLTGELKMNGQPISGLNVPTQDDQAANMGFVNQQVKKAAPRNLLDNSDFTILVAQAGIGGKHGEITYAADRWILSSGTVSYEWGTGLTLNGTIVQRLEKYHSNASAFVGMTGGSVSISYNASDKEVSITSSGGVLKWAALYEGEYTEETRPEYQPKGYAVELAECKRYFQYITKATVRTAGSATAGQMFFNVDGNMRISPTATLGSAGLILCGTFNPAIASIESISFNPLKNGGYLTITPDNDFPDNNWYSSYEWVNGIIALCADL